MGVLGIEPFWLAANPHMKLSWQRIVRCESAVWLAVASIQCGYPLRTGCGLLAISAAPSYPSNSNASSNDTTTVRDSNAVENRRSCTTGSGS